MALRLKYDAQVEAPRLAQVAEIDLARLGGGSVFRSKRVPFKSLFDRLGDGDSVEVFLNDFPGVTWERVRAVLEPAGYHLVEAVQHWD